MPTRLKQLRGNPGKRAPRKEPEPKAAELTAPAWIDGDARKEWDRIAPELGRLGLLTIVDVPALAGYCVAYQRWREAELAVKKCGTDGLAVAITQGLEGMARDRLRLMKAMAAEFGFTPASRSKVTTLPPQAEDPFEDFAGLKAIDGGKKR